MQADFTPQPHDFRFTHEGKDYCIGYIDTDAQNVMCAVKNESNQWVYFYSLSIYPTMPNFSLEGFMDTYLERVNIRLEQETGVVPDPFPDVGEEFLPLLMMIYNNLRYENGKVVRF